MRIGMIAALVASSAVAATAVPPEARTVIAQVQAASARGDLAALRPLMADDFTWSFGGDASADQALAEWKRNPKRLAALARVTALPCGFDPPFVECPRNAGTGYRAGFTKTPAGWRMAYFVAGD